MKKARVLGAILLIIPLLIAAAIILRSTRFWYGMDVVVFFIAGIAGLSLLARKDP